MKEIKKDKNKWKKKYYAHELEDLICSNIYYQSDLWI